MSKRELILPDFLKETADDIHKRMLKQAPEDVTTIEGDFFWDMTRPSAEEKARLIQLQLQNILRLTFPQTSYGPYLEYLGECKGIFKNSPTNSIGIIRFYGKPGTVIEKGKIVSTSSTDYKQNIEFEILETNVINESENITVKAECKEPGIIGNVKKGSITLLIKPINGVKALINEEDFKGGTDIEDEEHFRERVLEEYKNEATSGNEDHYIKWAKEVNGVGYAYVISEWKGPGTGTTKVLILDKNGKPATKELIDRVQDYISPSGKNRGGKAPVQSNVTIDTPSTIQINIKAKFKFKEGFNKEFVLNNLKDNLNKYISNIDIGGTILYNAIHTIVGSIILTGEGIEDFKELYVNDIQENIDLNNQVAILGEVVDI